MASRTWLHKKHQRVFAGLFLLATISLLGLVVMELLFPPAPLPPPAERSLLDLLEWDLPDPKLLAVVVALVADLASLACLVVTVLLGWLEARHRRRST